MILLPGADALSKPRFETLASRLQALNAHLVLRHVVHF